MVGGKGWESCGRMNEGRGVVRYGGGKWERGGGGGGRVDGREGGRAGGRSLHNTSCAKGPPPVPATVLMVLLAPHILFIA